LGRPLKEKPADDSSLRAGRIHGRWTKDQVALKDEIARNRSSYSGKDGPTILAFSESSRILQQKRILGVLRNCSLFCQAIALGRAERWTFEESLVCRLQCDLLDAWLIPVESELFLPKKRYGKPCGITSRFRSLRETTLSSHSVVGARTESSRDCSPTPRGPAVRDSLDASVSCPGQVRAPESGMHRPEAALE
jgi:hypothetical protein